MTACKNNKLFKGKSEQSETTGWNYNDKDQGGYYKAKANSAPSAPGLVFVQGGTFTMGSTQQDVMGDWNNRPRRVTVSSFFIDKYEVSNLAYREYIHWMENAFSGSPNIINAAKPDTLVWRSELAYNEPYVEYYFRHPSYNNYPVVGVTWKQAHDYCIWRTDRVNQKALIDKGYQSKEVIKTEMNGAGKETFNTQAYLAGAYAGTPSTPGGKGKSTQLLDAQGNPRSNVQFEDGILTADYRLPTEAEWEYAALGLVENNIKPSDNKKIRGDETLSDKQLYPWQNDGFDGLRVTKKGKRQGEFMANFKRGNGDYMGTAGGLNDNAATPGPIDAFAPNGYGLYNMAGNVSEWVADVYRQNTSMDENDLNPYRGNEFKQPVMQNGQPVRDSMGRLEYTFEPDSISNSRRNYTSSYAANYLDGDSASGIYYGYGVSTLVNDHSRVYKGGSWNDMPYWLSPGTRRFLDENQSSAMIGFRCAMTHYGEAKGDGGAGSGNQFTPTRRKRR
ncbi:SUMF1/EgtB/PvdO family nonheme iron enzyme [Rhizosphaericola mali]|uniref:SUMF1/EgtB/PvdO family nonheme iron enzyme n=2 Tax=Rhizosphaericola mali TaxID=2545455 RepID=A0A5P2GCV5_9BACT|nr:SUMF1/EgtB/PvdO family nonheme iron enzyme [Rhizosphaericola mali]